VRLNGFVRSTEDIDILLPSSIDNGRTVIRALHFLASSAELDPEWFDIDPVQPAITLAPRTWSGRVAGRAWVRSRWLNGSCVNGGHLCVSHGEDDSGELDQV